MNSVAKLCLRQFSVFLCLAVTLPWSLSTVAQPTARLGISPDKYLVEFGAGGSTPQSLMIKNLSDEPVTVKLSVSNWDLDDNNQVRVIPPTENSLDQWIVINPLRVVIPPDTPQTIRWAILPKQAPQAGEYRAIIFIEEELPEREHSDNPSLRMSIRFGIPVYAQRGEPADRLQLQEAHSTPDGMQVVLNADNQGNRHARLRGSYGLWPRDQFPGKDRALKIMRDARQSRMTQAGYTVGMLPETVLLPANRRQIALLPPDTAEPGMVVQLDATFGPMTIEDTIRLSQPQR